MTSTLWYDLGGHRLAVFAANDELLARFDRSYAAFRLENPQGDAGFRLDLVEGELPTPPAGFVLTFDGILPYDGPCRSYAAGEPVARADILTSLAADNLRQSRAGLLPLQRRRFAMLTRLATTCPVYELRAGSDIDRLADVVAAKIRETP